jgi:CRISPR-associated endonuclease/helicase Cas3
MECLLVGHSWTDDDGKKHFQSLEDHSRMVAMICAENSASVGLRETGYVEGLLHDLGKADRRKVQPHLRGETAEKCNHSVAGARYIWEKYGQCEDLNYRLAAQLIASAIVWHHSGRQDIVSMEGDDKWLKQMHFQEKDSAYEATLKNFFSECCEENEIEERMKKAAAEIGIIREKIKKREPSSNQKKLPVRQYFLGMLQRFLFSALIDADWTDTSCIMSGKPLPKKLSSGEKQELWNDLSDQVETFVESLKPKYEIDRLRQEISQQCLQAATDQPGIYRLFVPTGGGKTYSGLRFCIHTAQKRNADKIYYFAPYKSILSQNTDDFKRALGNSEYVLEHHSDIIIDDTKEEQAEYNARQRLMRERWQDVPFIATTMVQFLNTLFAGPRQNVRRMEALAHSILVFDEVQALPVQDTFIFNMAVNFLADILDCTIVLCTATQPALEDVKYPIQFSNPKDLVPDYEERFQQFKRVRVVIKRISGGFTAPSIADLVQELLERNRSLLIILNTKHAVNTVYDQLSKVLPKDIPKYCLTTGLCIQHRADVIQKIKNWQADAEEKTGTGMDSEEKMICVSTQIIEAGVDVSFDCVIRSMAGITSVAQAAGRCNRHGRYPSKDVYLINCTKELENLDQLQDIDDARQATERLLDVMPPDIDLLAPEVVRKYYQIYYQNDEQMEYMVPIPGIQEEISLRNLLGINSRGRKEWKKENQNPGEEQGHNEKIWQSNWKMWQAFQWAEKNFHAISNDTVTVVVPYHEEGQKAVAWLTSAHPGNLSDLIRMIQPYTVEIHKTMCKKLEREHALVSVLDGTVLVLQAEFYDQAKGVEYHPLPMEAMFQ